MRLEEQSKEITNPTFDISAIVSSLVEPCFHFLYLACGLPAACSEAVQRRESTCAGGDKRSKHESAYYEALRVVTHPVDLRYQC